MTGQWERPTVNGGIVHIKPATHMLGVQLDPPRLALNRREVQTLQRASALAERMRTFCHEAGLVEVESSDDLILAYGSIGPDDVLDWLDEPRGTP